jgi:hypothetical protein
MIHHSVADENGAHYAVWLSAVVPRVLVQVQDVYGEQARVALALDEAEHLMDLLKTSIAALKERLA